MSSRQWLRTVRAYLPILPTVRGLTSLGLNNFTEPNFLIYQVDTPSISKAVSSLQEILPAASLPKERDIVRRGTEARRIRVAAAEQSLKQIVSIPLI